MSLNLFVYASETVAVGVRRHAPVRGVMGTEQSG